MKNLKVLIFICVWLVGGIPSAYAADINKKPLNEVFDRMVVVPYDFQEKAFVGGQLTDLYGDYQMVQRNGRVMVPIRLMAYLATQADRYQDTWEAIWQPQHPDDVILRNSNLHKTIKFTVNSKTMRVNNQPQTMDVAPQIINGRIMLPLRSAAAALGKKIDWLTGLILIGDEYVDLQHPQTLDITGKIKSILTDARKPVDYDLKGTPIAKYGDSIFYFRYFNDRNGAVEQLYKKTDGKQEVQVQLPGKPVLHSAKVINHELYYVSTVNHQGELDAFDFADNQYRKICAFEQWTPADGWLADVRYIDNELYVNLHSGELTMGGEALFKVDNGAAKMIANAHNFIQFIKAGDYLYETDFHPMVNEGKNLYRVNMQTGKFAIIEEPGYAYGIVRKSDGHGTSLSGNRALYIKDGFLYTLGYKQSDLKDESAVYKINLADQTQVKLTPSTDRFWLADNRIYYIDSASGYLKSVDLNGTRNQLLVGRNVIDAQFYNGAFYYLTNAYDNQSTQGELYQYDITNGREVKLSDKSASSFYVGKAGIYYLSKNYDSGLYRVDADRQNVRLVKDSIDAAILSDEGMVYTLTYKKGIYAVK